jgi:hypothetical protein
VTRSAELSEAARARIERLMPQAEGRSRPWRDQRQVIDGIVFRYRSGVAGGTQRRTRSLSLSEYSAPGGLR